LQFAVVDAETRKQFLLINGTQIKTLRPVKSKNVIPIHLVIGKPGNSGLTSKVETSTVNFHSCYVHFDLLFFIHLLSCEDAVC